MTSAGEHTHTLGSFFPQCSRRIDWKQKEMKQQPLDHFLFERVVFQTKSCCCSHSFIGKLQNLTNIFCHFLFPYLQNFFRSVSIFFRFSINNIIILISFNYHSSHEALRLWWYRLQNPLPPYLQLKSTYFPELLGTFHSLHSRCYHVTTWRQVVSGRGRLSLDYFLNTLFIKLKNGRPHIKIIINKIQNRIRSWLKVGTSSDQNGCRTEERHIMWCWHPFLCHLAFLSLSATLSLYGCFASAWFHFASLCCFVVLSVV